MLVDILGLVIGVILANSMGQGGDYMGQEGGILTVNLEIAT